MKKIMILAAAVAMMAACAPKEQERKVMARAVPERMDDFVWENNLICGRVYGKALEGDPTAPGTDVWVKLPGGLVADQRYKDELENGKSYHIDWGNGKDCYKVSVSLGGGASSPLVDGQLIYPATNYRSYDILTDTPEEVVFVLHYPAWEVDGHQVALDRKMTVVPDTYFVKAEDTYTGDFESLVIAAGVFDHGTCTDPMTAEDRFALWEDASDQSVEPEDGKIGVALVLPGAESVTSLMANKPHMVCTKTVKPGETVTYWFGSCWSKGDVKTAEDWYKITSEQ